MAKSSETWIPSGGVLAVAIGAGLVAAILVNVYISYFKSAYEQGAKGVLQLKDDVEAGTKFTAANLKKVMVPQQFVPAFEKAVKAEDTGLVISKQARRRFYKDEILFYPDFIEMVSTPGPGPPLGYEWVTVPVEPTTSPGQQVQPGAYVTIRGDFQVGADPRAPQYEPKSVMENVQVKALDGSTEVAKDRTHSQYNNITIQVKSAQALIFQKIKGAVRGGKFTVTPASPPEGSAAPDFSKDILEYLAKPRGGGAPLPVQIAPPPIELPPASGPALPAALPPGPAPAATTPAAAPAAPAPATK
jgi:Flp pilus assembly protein CpaB